MSKHPMTAPPKRRWFRFSLRTMFIVVTIFGVWLGWQLQIVRERKELIRLLNHLPEDKDSHVSITRLEEIEHDPSFKLRQKFSPSNEFDSVRIAWFRRMLGDEAYLSIHVEHPLDRQFLNRLEVAFPEAVLAYHERRGENELAFRDSLL